MRRLIHHTLALLLGLAVLSSAALAAEGASVRALLISASKGKGASDPQLAQYVDNLKSTLPFDTFKLAGQGSASVSAAATINLPGGHRVQLSDASRSGDTIKIRVEWTQGNRQIMATSLTLQAGLPAIIGRGSGEGEVPVVLLIAR